MKRVEQVENAMEVATDVTSWYGFLAYLTGDLKTTWARDNYLDVTVLTLLGADLRTPLPPNGIYGPGFALYPLRDHFIRASIDDETCAQAWEEHKHWFKVPTNVERAKKSLEETLHDESYSDWIQWHVEYEWPEHIRRCVGLVEQECESLVSLLVPYSSDDIKEVNQVALGDRDRFPKRAHEMHHRLFTADVIRRGVYYKILSTLYGRQQIMHQSRKLRLETERTSDYDRIILGFEPFMVAELIRGEAESTKRRFERVERWTYEVERASYALRGNWELPDANEFEADQKTFDAAIEWLRELSQKLEYSKKWRRFRRIERFVGAALGGAAGGVLSTALSLGVNPYTGALVGASVGAGATEAIDWALSKHCPSDHPAVKKLTKGGPGDVRSHLEL